MAINHSMWEAIRAGVMQLPHRVEWYEDAELEKHLAGKPATPTVEVRDRFLVPGKLVELMGSGGELVAMCRELAEMCGCDLQISADESLLFIKRK
jgi:hypothetical protein